jgi:hypothetical protein
MSDLTESDIKHQSINCYNQWAEQWRRHADYHGKRFPMLPMTDFHQVGVGRAVLCIANGSSFEENLATIQKYQGNVDIMVCDKTLKSCLDHGIIPTYCMLCDANVSYEKYCEPVKDKLQNTILFSNVCAATKWAVEGNWKQVYFYANQDCLGSEQEFMTLSGCPNMMVAGTNVSNAMVVLLTQSDNDAARNFFGYDKILLIGFDYCWDDKYYAFDHDGGGKINYMRQVFIKNLNDDFCYSSPNLLFSAKWFTKYIKAFQIPAVQCTKKTIVDGFKMGDLAEQMQYCYNAEDGPLLRKLIATRDKMQDEIGAANERIQGLAIDHTLAFLRTT